MRMAACVLFALSVFLCACSGESVDKFDLSKLFYDWTDSHLAIKNSTGYDIAVFRNSVSQDNLLGGVKVGQELRVKQLDGLQVLLAIKADDYASGDYASARVLDSQIAYVYQNEYITNVFIDRTKSGNGLVRIDNQTEKNLEIYSGYWGGQLIATVPPKRIHSQYLPNDEITFYPALVTPVLNNNEVVSISRQQVLGLYRVSPDPQGTTYSFTQPEVKNEYIYLHLKNESASGIYLLNGDIVLKNTLGRNLLNPDGRICTYEFSPEKSTDRITLTSLKISYPGLSPILVGGIVITNGGSHYMIFKQDKTVLTNQSAF